MNVLQLWNKVVVNEGKSSNYSNLSVLLRNNALVIGVWIAFFIELGLITFLANEKLYSTNNFISQHNPENYIRPIIYSLATLSICLFPLFIKKDFFEEAVEKKSWIDSKDKIISMVLITVAGIFYTTVLMYRIIHQFEPLIQNSDIIVVLDVFVTRFLNGEEIYREFTEIGYNVIAGYLPVQWMTFVVPKILGFDFRWMAFIVLVIGIIYYQYVILKQNSSLIEMLVKASLPFIIIYYSVVYLPSEIGWTVENLICGFYIILALSIFSNSNIVRASALVICLLSRFSLVFWIPLYLLFIFLFERKKNAIQIACYTFLGVLVLFIIPYLSKNWSLIMDTQKIYTQAALGEWSGQFWQPKNAKPMQLFRGYGFACYFYDFLNVTILEKIKIIKVVHLVLSIGALIVAGFVYRKVKDRIDYKLYCLLALKFYFLFFYGFIQVPYPYLFLVPSFVSIVVLMKLPMLRLKL